MILKVFLIKIMLFLDYMDLLLKTKHCHKIIFSETKQSKKSLKNNLTVTKL